MERIEQLRQETVGLDPASLPQAAAFRSPFSVPPPGASTQPLGARAWAQPGEAWPSTAHVPAPHSGVPNALPPAPRPPLHVAPSGLDQAQYLYDAGYLEAPAALCVAHLRSHRTSAQAYYLLGQMREASNAPGAFECCRKALYLHPHHLPTLLRMTTVAEKRRDSAAAGIFERPALRHKVDPVNP